ncbi:MAG: N-6 DNA methylase [Deltaproteobacteria bacterium]|nr:N-6 DNA methylase [Deltaproteobacteria bacterium]
MPLQDSAEVALTDPNVEDAIGRGIVEIEGHRVTYNLRQRRTYDWTDPEEWVRARTIAWLIIARDYPAARILTEVSVPRRTPSDFADIVVFRDDSCREPFLVVENKASGQDAHARDQAIEQAFGNANSLRAALALYDEHETSDLYNVGDFPALERMANRLGSCDALPRQYGDLPEFAFTAGGENDIRAADPARLSARIRRAHAAIWAGGRRDPLAAFDEWSKLLFAKVVDERTTPTGQPRRFQVGGRETVAAVANRIQRLFNQACRDDPAIFPAGTSISLPDPKVAEVVRILQDVGFVRTDIDSIGTAFEEFFGSVFRGDLGQYFTARHLCRFTVVMLGLGPNDHVLDPTAGSGGFLLEALLQLWHNVDRDFRGQPQTETERLKLDFALQHVYGVEIHPVLGRICKINLLLHHDGHTHIESDRSCLDAVFGLERMNPPSEKFSVIVGNPPFGDEVRQGDPDHLGENELCRFELAAGRQGIDSEQVILERCVELLEPDGRLGLVLPDGLFNNQGSPSNCPRTRAFLARSGWIEAVVSLPDFAFRKAGAQNKTSILFFRKFTRSARARIDGAAVAAGLRPGEEDGRLAEVIAAAGLSYHVFLAEASNIGYTPIGTRSVANDLFSGDDGHVADEQSETILGEFRAFRTAPEAYRGRRAPDCMALPFADLWNAHPSHRLDPKYHIFRREEARVDLGGWTRTTLGQVMRRRTTEAHPEREPDRVFTVMTLSQTGEIRPRAAGKGRNPPEWRGSYFEDSSSRWYAARAGDVVFSSIDLWKGCIAVVPPPFDGALVTREFPIYEVIDPALDSAFLSHLLRTRYYQRAFRAITTGHSNRRRTQEFDFEALSISFPRDRSEQADLLSRIADATGRMRRASEDAREAMLALSDRIDGRGAEVLPDIGADGDADE